MPDRSNILRVSLALALVSALALPAPALAEEAGTQLGLRIADSSQSQGGSDPSTGQPGSTTLGIRLTDSVNPAPLTVALVFEANGGSAVEAQTVPYNAAPSRPADPVRAGYRFDGWCADETLTTPFDFDAPLTAAATAYAKWVAQYTIAFFPNGGDGAMDPVVLDAGEYRALPACGFSRGGYGGGGWNTKPDGSGTFFEDGATVLDVSSSAGATVSLYAQWSLKIICTVPATASLSIDASGQVKGEDLAFSSSTVAPLEVSAVESEELSGASSLIPDAAARDGARGTLPPAGDASRAVEVPLATGGAAAPTGFVVPESSDLAVSFGLALPDGARLSYAEEARDVARLSYTVAAAPLCLQDGKTGEAYSLEEVKRHAEDIAEKGEGSPHYAAYAGYLADEGSYSCTTVWGGTAYDVRIIGIAHDDKADGTGKAGLTFQFVNVLEAEYQMNVYNQNTGGWDLSVLRANMNGGGIWNTVPSALQDAIAPVVKRSSTTSAKGEGVFASSEDKLFLASYFELTGAVYLGWNESPWLAEEGEQYAYWKAKAVAVDGSGNEALRKGRQSSPASSTYWWERTVSPGSAGSFCLVYTSGSPTNYGSSANAVHGVCPCFCL